MNIPKLSAAQWFRLVTSLLPLLRGLVRVAGVSIVTVIRALIDIVAQVEDLYAFNANDIDPDTGRPRKRGAEKLAAFRELVIAAFATADEAAAAVESRVGDLGQIASTIVGLLNQWGYLRPAAVAVPLLNSTAIPSFDQSVK